jgi:hypothetical protein
MSTTTTPPATLGRRRTGRLRVTRPRTLPVRTRVTVTVTVDPHAWHREYGCGTTPAAVRADVTAYLATALNTARIWPALTVTTEQETTR